ncbi:HNH endonuclease [Pseudomonas sp. DWP3-1-2]|uniref:HNH endonuclease n=1 Tax=Pseudomonas sp. DWP3-1-2 TaxID=2804645 RepID=UPI003CF625C1
MSKNILQPSLSGVFASQRLEAGKVYTRDDLKGLFQITASSINNGIFKPTGLDSVWIFVTEHKTADRTQYNDRLTGDLLWMEGQLKGGTDPLIKEHIALGLELLVFYRKKKYEHPGAGFTFEGRFTCKGYEGSAPTQFKLQRASSPSREITVIEAELDTQRAFDPDGIVDARKRVLSSIVRRQGQAEFRKKLLTAYSGQCAVTGCLITALLEAAHVVPYQGTKTNVVSNGLLLRADIHTLYDLGLLWIDPDTLRVNMVEPLKSSEYGALANKPIFLPETPSDRPSREALQSHLNTFRVLGDCPSTAPA